MKKVYTVIQEYMGASMRRLLLGIYGFAFFNKFLLLTPVYAIFMQQNGLNDLQLSTMFIISALGTILCQGPITFITNRLGQRWSMMIGQMLKVFAIVLWLVLPNYTGFVIGMFAWGAQAGFRSVAFEGLVYDGVAIYGNKRDYSRILGRKSTYESVGVALSAFGSLLMFMGYTWVTWASVVAILISMICLIILPHIPIASSKNVVAIPMRKLLRSGLNICLKIPCLMSVMILTLLIINIPFLDDFLSPIGLQIGIPTEYVGVVPLFLLGCATIGQRFAYRFTKIHDGLLYSLIGGVGAAFIAFGLHYDVWSLWIMGIAYMLFYGIYTLLYSRFQHMIPPRHRSVVLSVYTTLNYVLYMIVCGVVGLGATLGSWRFSIIILGLLMLVVCAWAMLYVRRQCPLNK
ncbi:MAG: MFS transporter [Alphaproteobacteria bacterium]|nr:MFS transporter [Alphaproteobacteria bacterium]MBQ8729417.1 MFS transporter [Alphaproteobacteria bacterium]